jgi:hypothetical protein
VVHGDAGVLLGTSASPRLTGEGGGSLAARLRRYKREKERSQADHTYGKPSHVPGDYTQLEADGGVSVTAPLIAPSFLLGSTPARVGAISLFAYLEMCSCLLRRATLR